MVPVRSVLINISARKDKAIVKANEQAHENTCAGTEYETSRSEKHPDHNRHPHNDPVIDSKSS